MNKLFLQIQTQVDALSLRERGLVFLSGTAVIFMFWTFLLFDPQNAELEVLQLQMQETEKKLSVRAQEATVLAQTVGINADQAKMMQLAELKRMSAMLDEQMAEMSLELIPAGELLGVVREVLEQSNELRIERIDYLPPEVFDPGTRRRSSPGIFRHTVELTLEGSYFDLLEYLQGLEALPWRLHWDTLNYEVTHYPVGDIELTVSTLSTSGVRFEKL